jgi:parallel beta-helix repeat protein
LNTVVGIELGWKSNYNYLDNNLLDRSQKGVFIDYSNSNTLVNNSFYKNGNGVYLRASHDNLIYNNNFVSNSGQCNDEENDNIWNFSYPKGGNYWNDFDEPNEGAYDIFQGKDQDLVGSDGIVDKGSIVGTNPYMIDNESIDHYPLIKGIDLIPPSIDDVMIRPEVLRISKGVNISTSVNDNIPELEIHVEIFDPENDLLGNYSMIHDTETNRYYLNTSFEIRGKYTYTIWAEDIGDNLDTLSGSFVMYNIPDAPGELNVNHGESFVNFTWSSPISDGGLAITSYTIFRGISSDQPVLLEKVGNVSSYNDTDVVRGVTYFYWVCASNILGRGPLSDGVNATPDSDHDSDGIGDIADPDDDNDGYPDEEDAFPLDPEEWEDFDIDGTGNNLDSDDDNDGSSDDVDAFPLDPTEWTDTDGDTIGNNADTDDDGDGVPDPLDEFPLDPTRWGDPSLDTDSDGIPDIHDTDDDNDGVPDEDDDFPLDPLRQRRLTSDDLTLYILFFFIMIIVSVIIVTLALLQLRRKGRPPEVEQKMPEPELPLPQPNDYLPPPPPEFDENIPPPPQF